MRVASIKVPPGSDLRVFLENLSKEKKYNGFMLGAVGNFSKATFQCPGNIKTSTFESTLELITLNGTVILGDIHLHLSVSDNDCRVWGGHLEEGTIVLKGVDLLIGLLDDSEIQTSFNEPFVQQQIGRVEIFILPNCPWSERAIRMLNKLSIPHLINVIDSDKKYEEVKIRSNLKTFPQIFIDNEIIGGYNELAEMHGDGKLKKYQLK